MSQVFFTTILAILFFLTPGGVVGANGATGVVKNIV